MHESCRDKFWYWETVVLVQTLGLVAAQVFAVALDGSFQLTITLLILVTGGLALAYCHPFEQEGPQIVQVCIVMLQARPKQMSLAFTVVLKGRSPINAQLILDVSQHCTMQHSVQQIFCLTSSTVSYACMYIVPACTLCPHVQ